MYFCNGVEQIYFPHKFISVAQVSVIKELKLCDLRIKLFPNINLFLKRQQICRKKKYFFLFNCEAKEIIL